MSGDLMQGVDEEERAREERVISALRSMNEEGRMAVETVALGLSKNPSYSRHVVSIDWWRAERG